MEIQYSTQTLLRLAKRVNNKKRTYLLVNPLQAKHIPVSPTTSIGMMKALGYKVSKLYSKARLVIGFAETATAIGAVVASCISDDCAYIHTTREEIPEENSWIEFLEEHSHATEQKLSARKLEDYFNSTDTIILVDDEISTGKTLINMVDMLRSAFPVLGSKTIVAASIINRMSSDNIERLRKTNIDYVCLLKIEEEDYTSRMSSVEIKEATILKAVHCGNPLIHKYHTQNPRVGVVIGEYTKELERVSHEFIDNNSSSIIGNVLILGTEECMYPALLLGEAIEDRKIANSVKCHATTRSPIGISEKEGYPITNGFKLHSLYQPERTTFIYNIKSYDTVIIVTDAKDSIEVGIHDLYVIFNKFGISNFLVMVGGERV